MHKGSLAVNSSRKIEFIDITSQIERAVMACGCNSGICHLYNPHTTAGITINEGADPAVQEDLTTIFKGLIPENQHYQHLEGNSPAHAMATMVGSSVMVFVDDLALQLGTWQRIFFCEFDGPRHRTLHWRLISD